MMLKLRCIFFLLYGLLVKYSLTFPIQTANISSDYVEESLRVRVRRQDGYVYDKPGVSFDLPQRSTPAPTQAPNVDRTLTQQMFYAYPVPAGGNTVNIGQTAGSTAATAAPTTGSSAGGSTGGSASSGGGGGGAGGYNYRSSITANAGYNYGTASTGAQTNTNSQVTNTGSQTSGYGTQTATNTGVSQADSGYGRNAPSPTLSPTLQGSIDVSTNAPKYLPPSGSGAGGSIGTGGSVNVGSVSVTSGSGQVTTGSSTSVQTGSVGTPSDTYLPPLGTSNTLSTSTSSQTNTGGSVSVPSSAYLPPNTATQPSPAPSPSPPAPAPPASYIPPSRPNSGTVSTPASTYLPPSFF